MNDIVINKIQSIHRCIERDRYQQLNIAVAEAIIKTDLDDLILFGDAVIEFLDK